VHGGLSGGIERSELARPGLGRRGLETTDQWSGVHGGLLGGTEARDEARPALSRRGDETSMPRRGIRNVSGMIARGTSA